MSYKKTIAFMSFLIINTTNLIVCNTTEKIIQLIEQATASNDESFKINITEKLAYMFSDKENTDIRLTDQDKEKIILFLQQDFNGRIFPATLFYVHKLSFINNLLKREILTIQDKKYIMPILKLAMIDNGSHHQNQIFETISRLAEKNILTPEDRTIIIPHLQKTITKKNLSYLHGILYTVRNLAATNILTAQDKKDIMPLFDYILKKDFNFNASPFSLESSIEGIQLQTLIILTKAKIVSIQEILPLLNKAVKTQNQYTQEITLKGINELSEAKILTAQDKEKILASNKK